MCIRDSRRVYKVFRRIPASAPSHTFLFRLNIRADTAFRSFSPKQVQTLSRIHIFLFFGDGSEGRNGENLRLTSREKTRTVNSGKLSLIHIYCRRSPFSQSYTRTSFQFYIGSVRRRTDGVFLLGQGQRKRGEQKNQYIFQIVLCSRGL